MGGRSTAETVQLHQLLDDVRGQGVGVGDIVVQHLDVSVPIDEDDGPMHRLIDGTIKVIRRSQGVVGVDGGGASFVTRVEHLEEVEFATTRLPARTSVVVDVLTRSWHVGVEQPEGRHVRVVELIAHLAIVRHLELEHERLFVTSEAI